MQSRARCEEQCFRLDTAIRSDVMHKLWLCQLQHAQLRGQCHYITQLQQPSEPIVHK